MLRNMKTIKRVSILFSIILIAFMLVISTITFAYSKSTIEKGTKEKALQILSQSSAQAENAIYTINQNSKLLMSKVNSLNVLQYKDYYNQFDTAAKNQIISSLNDFVFINKNVEAAYLFDNFGNTYGTKYYNYPYTQEDLAAAAAQGNGSLVWYPEADHNLVLCRTLYSNLMKPVGSLVIIVDDQMFPTMFSWQKNELGSKICVIDTSNNYPIYASATAFSEYSIQHLLWTEISDQALVNNVSVEGTSYALYKYLGDTNHLAYLYYIPSDYFTRGISKTISIVLVITGIFIVMFMILVANLNSSINKPLKLIGESLRHFTLKGDIPKIEFYYNDEFKELYNQFSEMADRIHRLVENTYEQEILNKTQELSILQAQINPHFVYNTFELINSIAADHNVTQICTMTKSLSNIMRYTINSQENEVAFCKELEHIQDYMKIQKERFMGGLTFITDIQADTLNCKMLRLTLQPIIENCIQHGFRNRWEQCAITVTAKLIPAGFMVSITDNGIGFVTDAVEDKHDSIGIRCSQGNGIALVNIDRRIKLRYASGSGLTIKSEPMKGTVVTIAIIYSKGGADDV